ncbi:MAG: hypothetical protein IKL24_06635 [Clostridia bacterium]|nr:hypothetical protein [Clostridia bacterium]
MAKRIISLLLCALLIASSLLFTACGEKKDEGKESNKADTTLTDTNKPSEGDSDTADDPSGDESAGDETADTSDTAENATDSAEPEVTDTAEPETTVPEPETTVPEPETTIPEPETTIPEPETTIPEPETTIPEPETTIPEPPVTEPEPTLGTEAEPYLEIPQIEGDFMSVTTVAIPSGKEYHYDIYRVGSMVLTVNDANAYVICGGTRYDAVNGTVTVIVPSALASDSVSFVIGNKGQSAASFKLIFKNPEGSMANPVKVTSIGQSYSVDLAAGDEDGHTYRYVAERAGTVRFYLTATADSILSVTNNRNSAQRNTDADLQGSYIELEVNAGDELIIIVGTKPNMRGKYPAATITWTGEYV